MSCPTECILGENITFTMQSYDATGAVGDATGSPAYSVYEDETTTPVLTGTMTKLASQTGFYSEQIACTAANGFERLKTYTIRITATVSGVATATVYSFLCLGIGDTVTSTSGALTTTANFKTYIGLTSSDDDTLIGYLISRATSAIEKYCGRTLTSTTYREFYDGDGTAELVLDEYPVTAITLLSKSRAEPLLITNSSTDAYIASVTITSTTMTLTISGGDNAGSDELTLADYTLNTLVTAIGALSKGWSSSVALTDYGVWGASELLPCSGVFCLDQNAYFSIPADPESEFIIYEDEGSVHLINGVFNNGSGNITVRYTAGYSTTPADLEQICIDLVNIYYKNRKINLSVKSEKLGDHSITMIEGTRNLPDSIMQRLAPYKKL